MKDEDKCCTCSKSVKIIKINWPKEFMPYMFWIVLIIMFFWPDSCNAKTIHYEEWYVERYCNNEGGESEYYNADRTRTDCLVPAMSIEFDFAKKWYECITQSMHYAMLNNNSAKCILIIESEDDMKYYYRAREFVKFYDLDKYIKLEIVKP